MPGSGQQRYQHSDVKPNRCFLLELPAEIRILIFSHLINRPVRGSGNLDQGSAAALKARGVTSGVSRVNIVQDGEDWKVVSLSKPPGFSLHSNAILRTCKEIHKEAVDLFFGNMLFVLNILNSLVPIPRKREQPAMMVAPTTAFGFMHSISHIHVRQNIHPDDDLTAKAVELGSILKHLRPDLRSKDVSLRFEWFNGAAWHRPRYAWEKYRSHLASLDLGRVPRVEVSYLWLQMEGKDTFNALALTIGGKLNSPDLVYW